MAALAGLALLPALASRISAHANFGAHGLTTGFGRGRLDLPGIVSEGSGGRIDLPPEPMRLGLRLSGDGPVRLQGEGVDQTILASDTPVTVTFDLPRGGDVTVQSTSRLRLHELTIDRSSRDWMSAGMVVFLGLLAVLTARRGTRETVAAAAIFVIAMAALARGRLLGTFIEVGFAQLVPLLVIVAVLLPLIVAFSLARFRDIGPVTRLGAIGFVSSLLLAVVQLLVFEQPLPMGDPGAYFEMGGKFAGAFARLRSPLGLGPILVDLQPYLALPATGALYGVLRLLSDGLALIYAAQSFAMAVSVAALVMVAESAFGRRAGLIALGLALIHPTFSVAPGIVQPEPFIVAAWTLGALIVVRASGSGTHTELRRLLAPGLFLGLGLALHPQGLSFLLLALLLCLIPWAFELMKQPSIVAVPLLSALTVLLPVAAAEHYAKPLAYILDKQYGFFAYTSPHPLGFWLYTDSDGWQGPLRIEDTTYQKELIAMKGESAVSSTFGDVVAFVARHPVESARTLLTNLHRLWNQPDNPFAVPFVLPYAWQIPLHRALIVLFVLSLPILLSSRAAVLALPFVMLSMTYPAYHVFNKYATPALPFLIIGAAVALDRITAPAKGRAVLCAALALAALGAITPAHWAASLGVPGDVFLPIARGSVWIGLTAAVVLSVKRWGMDSRARFLAALIGFVVLVGSSVTASRSDTARGAWSAPLGSFEVACRNPPHEEGGAVDPAWIFVDVQASDANPPAIEINGRALEAAVPTMPRFGLATVRGHRDARTFRQLWRSPVPEDLLAASDLRVRVTGSSGSRLFGDIRTGNGGPRLSLGEWPQLSVYRLMHEGQYRLPTFDMPPQACTSSVLEGRPGVFLARIAAGNEDKIATKSAPVNWIF